MFQRRKDKKVGKKLKAPLHQNNAVSTSFRGQQKYENAIKNLKDQGILETISSRSQTFCCNALD